MSRLALAAVLLAGCSSAGYMQDARQLGPGPYRVGGITIMVMEPHQAERICAELVGLERRAGCWRRQGDEHLIVTDRDAYTLVHELKHVTEGQWHP